MTLPPLAADKRAHEMNIASLFVDYLGTAKGSVASGLRPGLQDPAGEPDAVCVVAGREHGIELVDCWMSGKAAGTVWKAAREAYHLGKRGNDCELERPPARHHRTTSVQ